MRAAKEVEAMEESRYRMKTAMQDPDFPIVQPFLDGDTWILRDTMNYRIGATHVTVRVPKGFVTDFASIPRIFWLVLPPTGTYGRAAVIHDWLYWTGACTREQSDNLLMIAMKESHVSVLDQNAIYQAVHRLGSEAFRDDSLQRTRGYVRVLAPPNDTIPHALFWAAYEHVLEEKHVPDATPSVSDVSFCALGNSQNVPGAPSHP